MRTSRLRAQWAGIALACASFGACATPQAPAPASAPAQVAWRTLDTTIESRIAEHRYAGAVFAVARRDEVLHEAAVGLANIEAHAPMRTDTIFRQMSLTKPVTAVGVMILVDEGRIDLDAPVSSYLPELSGYVLEGAPVTARHLLTHTSGFGVFGTFPTPAPDLTLEGRIHQLSALTPSVRPGAQWQYSGFDGFDILARLIEVTSGDPYDVFMQRRVFVPLGMHDTTFTLSQAQTTRLAGLYGSEGGAIRATPPVFQMPAYPAGGAGLYSTVPDMLRFAQMLANEGQLGGVRILSASAVGQMRSEQLAANFAGLNPGMAWGLGVRVVADPAELHSALNRGAFGWSGAYGTHLWVDPTTGVAAVWMISTTTGGGAGSPHAEDFERLVMEALGDAH